MPAENLELTELDFLLGILQEKGVEEFTGFGVSVKMRAPDTDAFEEVEAPSRREPEVEESFFIR